MDENGQKPGIGQYGLWLGAFLVLLFLSAPVLIIAVISFDDSRILSFPPKTVSLRWYARVAADDGWRNSLWTSLQVALMTTVLATAAGFFASLALVRANFKHKMALYGLIITPMIIPNVIVAIAFYMAFARMGASGSVVAMAIGHSVLALPLTTIILSANLQSLDEAYERAALSLGASRWQTIRMITLPLAVPGLVSAALFAFLTSFDELLISLFLAGISAETLSVRIWNSLSLDVEPTIAAVSSLLIALTVVILLVNVLFQRRSD